MQKLKLSKIGFGTWGWEEILMEILLKKSISLLNYAFKNGINFFDTAPSYGNGKVENIIGQFIKEKKIKRSKIIISTKGGLYIIKKNIKEGQNFKPNFIENSINKSIKKMNIKYIDLFFLHSPRNNGFNYKRTFMKLNDLKKEGKIKFLV